MTYKLPTALKCALIIVLLLTHIQSINACQCAKVKKIKHKEIQEAEYIFIGKVVAVESVDAYNRKVVFDVIKHLKTGGSQRIEIITGYGTGDCGLLVQVGDEWYIFSQQIEGKTAASICGRSLSMNTSPTIVGNYNEYDSAMTKRLADNIKRVAKEIDYINRLRQSHKIDF